MIQYKKGDGSWVGKCGLKLTKKKLTPYLIEAICECGGRINYHTNIESDDEYVFYKCEKCGKEIKSDIPLRLKEIILQSETGELIRIDPPPYFFKI